MVLKFLAFVFLCHLLVFSNGDVEVRIDDLEQQVNELRDEVADLSKNILMLENTVVKRNIADQKLDKAIANVLLNNQEKASAYWREVVSYLDPSLLNQYLKSLVENAYLGNSDNFYYVLDFLIRNELYIGFPMLYKELEQHGELHSGQEVFALAHQIKSICGMKNELYAKIPEVVREVLAGPVILKNVDNHGYLIADKDNFPCDNRSACYQNIKSQISVDYLSSNTVEGLKNDKTSHWQFIGPDNTTELSLGYYIKNMDKDLFFIFGQRPPMSFLKGNTTIKPYYAQDMITQFLPALIPGASSDKHLLRIGVREMVFRKISYFYTGEYSKKISRLALTRMPIFQGDMKGHAWEVTPVNEDNIDNDIEGGDINEKCQFTM